MHGIKKLVWNDLFARACTLLTFISSFVYGFKVHEWKQKCNTEPIVQLSSIPTFIHKSSLEGLLMCQKEIIWNFKNIFGVCLKELRRKF